MALPLRNGYPSQGGPSAIRRPGADPLAPLQQSLSGIVASLKAAARAQSSFMTQQQQSATSRATQQMGLSQFAARADIGAVPGVGLPWVRRGGLPQASMAAAAVAGAAGSAAGAAPGLQQALGTPASINQAAAAYNALATAIGKVGAALRAAHAAGPIAGPGGPGGPGGAGGGGALPPAGGAGGHGGSGGSGGGTHPVLRAAAGVIGVAGAALPFLRRGLGQDDALSALLRRQGQPFGSNALDAARAGLLASNTRFGFSADQTLAAAQQIRPFAGTSGVAGVMSAARTMGLDPTQVANETSQAASMGALNGMTASQYAMLASKAQNGQQSLYMQSLTGLLTQGGMNLQDTSSASARKTADLMSQLGQVSPAMANPAVAAQTISTVGGALGNTSNANTFGDLYALAGKGQNVYGFMRKVQTMSDADRIQQFLPLLDKQFAGLDTDTRDYVESNQLGLQGHDLQQLDDLRAAGYVKPKASATAPTTWTPGNHAEAMTSSLSDLDKAMVDSTRGLQAFSGAVGGLASALSAATAATSNLPGGNGAAGNYSPVGALGTVALASVGASGLLGHGLALGGKIKGAVAGGAPAAAGAGAAGATGAGGLLRGASRLAGKAIRGGVAIRALVGAGQTAIDVATAPTTTAKIQAAGTGAGSTIGGVAGGAMGVAVGALVPVLGETGLSEAALGALGSWAGSDLGGWAGGGVASLVNRFRGTGASPATVKGTMIPAASGAPGTMLPGTGPAAAAIGAGTSSLTVDQAQLGQVRIDYLQIGQLDILQRGGMGGVPGSGGSGGKLPNALPATGGDGSSPDTSGGGDTSGDGYGGDTGGAPSATSTTLGRSGGVVGYLDTLQQGAYQDFQHQCEQWTEQMLTGKSGLTLPGGAGIPNAFSVSTASDFVHTSNPNDIPAGADVIFGKATSNLEQGHSGVSLGGGQFGSIWDGPKQGEQGYHIASIAQFAKDNGAPLLGYRVIPGSDLANHLATVTPSASGGGGTSLDSMFQAAGKATGLDPNLIKALGTAENNLQMGLVSSKGARGIMQLLPSTAKELGVTNIDDPSQNIAGGAAYLKRMLQRYGGNVDEAIGGYNMGPGNFDALLKKYGSDWFSNAPDETKGDITRTHAALAKLQAAPGGGGAGGAPSEVALKVTLQDPAGRSIGSGTSRVVSDGSRWSGVPVHPKTA